MSRGGALNDAEIQSEMNKMVRVSGPSRASAGCFTLRIGACTDSFIVCYTAGRKLISQVAFISQEAREKAREIQVKADEEFAIEKVRT
jgi:hypothetical protein